MPRDTCTLTVGITTRNRPDSLRRCLASLAILGDLDVEVIVVDDTSDASVQPVLADVPSPVRERVTLVEQPGRQGYIVARNAIVRRARAPYVLLLDDDTVVHDRGAVADALDVLSQASTIAAVAFAQAEHDGAPWPPATQPAPVDHACLVPAYIGFAHLLRRDVFLSLGGYREAFQFYGEEKDYCLRLLHAGYHVVYLPHARVMHIPDPEGRGLSRYLRFTIRNDCLCALFNEPWPLPFVSVPIRLWRYLKMRRNAGLDDPGGLAWIVAEVLRQLPQLGRERRPVSWHTLRSWRALRAAPPPFASRSSERAPATDHVPAGPLASADELVHADLE